MSLFHKIKKKLWGAGEIEPAPAVDLQAHEVRVGPHTVTPPEGWGMRESDEREGALFYRVDEGILEGQEPVIMLWRLLEPASSPESVLGNFWSMAGSGEWMSKGTDQLREGLAAERYHAQALQPGSGDAWLLTLALVRVSNTDTVALWAAAPRNRWDLVEKPFETMLGSLILHDEDSTAPAAGAPLDEVRRIKITRLLEKERRSYLLAFEHTKRTRADKVEGTEGICEGLFRIVADLPEAYVLCRPDILFNDGDGWVTMFVSKTPLSSFGPVRFKTASGMHVEILAPLAWSRVRLRVFGEIRSWRRFEEWTAEWLLEPKCARVYESLELEGVIHSVKPPERSAGCWWTEVDFGSAPVDAFWAALEVFSDAGAERVEVASDDSAPAYLAQWEKLQAC